VLSDLNFILVLVEAALKYYDDSRILAALYFTLEIILQVFGAVAGDNSVRLGHLFLFFAIFLLVACVLS